MAVRPQKGSYHHLSCRRRVGLPSSFFLNSCLRKEVAIEHRREPVPLAVSDNDMCGPGRASCIHVSRYFLYMNESSAFRLQRFAMTSPVFYTWLTWIMLHEMPVVISPARACLLHSARKEKQIPASGTARRGDCSSSPAVHISPYNAALHICVGSLPCRYICADGSRPS